MLCKYSKLSGDIRKMSKHFLSFHRLTSIHCRPVIFWKGRSGFTTEASLAIAALYFASSRAAIAKGKMNDPSLELSLVADSSLLFIYKTKIRSKIIRQWTLMQLQTRMLMIQNSYYIYGKLIHIWDTYQSKTAEDSGIICFSPLPPQLNTQDKWHKWLHL